MKQPIFTGSGAAIITPFTSETVDYPALRRLIDFQLLGKTDAIIVCGTTGEAATMSYVERMRAIETTVRHVDGRVPVIAGTGSNSAENAYAAAKEPKELYTVADAEHIDLYDRRDRIPFDKLAEFFSSNLK